MSIDKLLVHIQTVSVHLLPHISSTHPTKSPSTLIPSQALHSGPTSSQDLLYLPIFSSSTLHILTSLLHPLHTPSYTLSHRSSPPSPPMPEILLSSNPELPPSPLRATHGYLEECLSCLAQGHLEMLWEWPMRKQCRSL